MASERKGARASALKRVGIAALVFGAAAFALEGGEFGTLDLYQQRKEKARVTRSIDSLKRVVDSLRRYRDALEHDPATQERIAREVFGMVRGDKEVLYRFTDSTRGITRP
jgi:cell division protein FtsB